MLGSDLFFGMLVFGILAVFTVTIVYVSLSIQPILANVPGYTTPYTPMIANGVVCQTSNQIFLNQNNLTENNIQTVNTICTTSYISQTPSNTVSWLSPFAATISVMQDLNNFDGYLLLIFFLVNIGIIASVGLQNPPPSTMNVAFLFVLMIIIGFVALYFSNALSQVFNMPQLASAVTLLPQTRALVANLAEYEVLFGFVYWIVAAARSRGGGGGGTSAFSGAHL